MISRYPIIDVIIPAFNEELSIAHVINEIPANLVREIIVSDNNSSDCTAEAAINAGATVVFQPRQGYGNACLKAIEYVSHKENPPDIIVFIDGDYSDFPGEIGHLIQPIIEDGMDLVIGSRALGQIEKGAMQPQQIFGNWLATTLIRLIYGYHFTDLGPFRAVKFESLMAMQMQDKDYGWTVEMQVRAAKMKLKTTEVAVQYKKRIGKSKVSGTVKGTLLAGHKILWTIFKLI